MLINATDKTRHWKLQPMPTSTVNISCSQFSLSLILTSPFSLQVLSLMLGIVAILPFATAERFAIVSMVTGPAPKAYYAQSVTNTALYATKRGYAFRVYPKIDEQRPASWSKILALKKTITSKQFEWILWLDADVLITNFATRLDEFVPQDDNIDLVMSRDCANLNLGVFLLRSSPSSLDLLEEVYNGAHITNETIHHVWWENKSFIDLYNASEGVRNRTSLLPQKAINSYPIEHTGCFDASHKWSEGDFIVHFPGIPDELRAELFAKYLPRVLRHG